MEMEMQKSNIQLGIAEGNVYITSEICYWKTIDKNLVGLLDTVQSGNNYKGILEKVYIILQRIEGQVC